jgi:plasmid replication initiation protein
MREKIVSKSNALVQASYRLSVNEQRIVLSCISQIDSKSDPLLPRLHRIHASEISSKNAYSNVKSAALRLRERTVTLHLSESERLVTSWAQTVRYCDRSGEVYLRFSTDLMPFLAQIKSHFTSYQLQHVVGMSSAYGVRLYELMSQYRSVGSRVEQIEDARRMLGVDEGEYKRMPDFTRRVLNPAMKDVNTHSDMWVKSEYKKAGRRVTHLQLSFGEKKKPSKTLSRQYIERHADPGESYEQAARRLSAQ